MRVLTWNVWGLRGGTRNVAAVLRSARADVACLQECPRGPLARPRTRLLARAAGMRLAGLAAGVALLVRPGVEVDDVRVAREPRPWTGWWWSYPRASVAAGLRVPAADGGPETADGGPETRVLAVAVHLDVNESARRAHVDRIVTTHRHEPRWFLAGDLNAAPGDPARNLLARALSDAPAAPTYPAGRHRPPHAPIDAVLAAGLSVTTVVVPHARSGDGRGRHGRPLSDHLPVLATLRAATAD